MAKSPITTHVLDTSRGRPAAGIAVLLEQAAGDGTWKALGQGITDDDGRIADLLPPGEPVPPGVYRLTFEVAPYQARQGVAGFYPRVPILFEIKDAAQHYHVPLLLNPFGYSTYRGS